MRLGPVFRMIVVVSFVAAIGLWAVGSFLLSSIALSAPTLISGAWVVFTMSLLGLACAACFDRGRLRRLMVSGIVAGGIATAVWLSMLWALAMAAHDESEWLARYAGTFTVWAGLTALVAMLHVHRTLNPIAVGCRRCAIACGAVLAVLVVAAIWFNEGLSSRQEDLFAKSLGAMSVLTGCATLATFLLIRIRQLDADDDDDEDGEDAEDQIRLDFTITCPRCALRQPLQTGGAECGRCGLRIRVLVP